MTSTLQWQSRSEMTDKDYTGCRDARSCGIQISSKSDWEVAPTFLRNRMVVAVTTAVTTRFAGTCIAIHNTLADATTTLALAVVTGTDGNMHEKACDQQQAERCQHQITLHHESSDAPLQKQESRQATWRTISTRYVHSAHSAFLKFCIRDAHCSFFFFANKNHLNGNFTGYLG